MAGSQIGEQAGQDANVMLRDKFSEIIDDFWQQAFPADNHKQWDNAKQDALDDMMLAVTQYAATWYNNSAATAVVENAGQPLSLKLTAPDLATLLQGRLDISLRLR